MVGAILCQLHQETIPGPHCSHGDRGSDVLHVIVEYDGEQRESRRVSAGLPAMVEAQGPLECVPCDLPTSPLPRRPLTHPKASPKLNRGRGGLYRGSGPTLELSVRVVLRGADMANKLPTSSPYWIKYTDPRGVGNHFRLIGVKATVYYFAIWYIWSALGSLLRLYWLLLSLVGLYTLFSAASNLRAFSPRITGMTHQQALGFGLRHG